VAIYHLSAQVLGRGKRRNQDGSPRKRADNAVAAAAYRSGSTMTCERTKQSHQYAGRRGVAHAEILTPEGSAEWLKDRAKLWNAVERMETRKDAQVARELNMALPHELSHAERVDLVRSFVAEQFVSKGMVADFALHDPVAEKGDDPRNFHAHIMLTMRQATATGLRNVKTREWNSRGLVDVWRGAWEEHTNRALQLAGRGERIDRRTLAAQREDAQQRGDRAAVLRLEREPEIHVGPKPRTMARRAKTPASRQREVGAYRTDDWRQHKRRGDAEAARLATVRQRREQAKADRDAATLRRWAERPERPRGRVLTPEERERWQTSRRIRDYPASDKGPRIGWLADILTGNNMQAKYQIARIDQKAAQFSQWLDYWQKKGAWHRQELAGMTPETKRFMRAFEAEQRREAVQRKIEHARRREQLTREIIRGLQLTLGPLRLGLESSLTRERQVKSWLGALARESVRAVGQVLEQGRERQRRRQGPTDAT
jgi:hypothetical protein